MAALPGTRAIGFIAALLFASQAEAASRPIVLELFTSQGCSSCPPADRFLSELATRSDVLPLAFHVTYWNGLGWHDPFSLEAATARQSYYAIVLNGDRYTPQLVVDGRRGVIGSERGDVLAAIAAARGEAQAVPVAVSGTAGKLQVRVGAGSGSGKIWLVGFDPVHRTAVGRGENAGQTLTESNIVRSIEEIGHYNGEPVTLAVPKGSGRAAAVLVQGADGRILGAARL
jgi:hypothetical protein